VQQRRPITAVTTDRLRYTLGRPIGYGDVRRTKGQDKARLNGGAYALVGRARPTPPR